MIWISDCYSRNIHINSVIIKQKALKLYQGLKDSDCVSSSELQKYESIASQGWLNSFKNR